MPYLKMSLQLQGVFAVDRSELFTDLKPPTTPAWVVDEPLLGRFLGNFQRALEKHWPNSILGYSFKTNSLPWLISFMRDRGAWAEVVSDTEYELALRLGYAPDRIVYNGPIKGRERLRRALQEGSIINLDSKREVAWTAELARQWPEEEFAVGLRVNWDLASRVPGESVVGDKDDGRFGFDYQNDEFDDAIAELRAAGVRVSGLHMHRNSFHQSLEVFQASATVAAELITSRELELDWVDVGGGFFGSVEGSPTFDDYVSVIRKVLEPVVDVDKTRLIVEPGGSLVAVPMEFHASVLDVKEINGKTYLVTDASRTDIDPLFRRRRPFAVDLETNSTHTLPTQIVGGFTCMDDDRLTTLEDAPALQIGDRIVFSKVGGYTMCYQSMFIEYLPAVYVRSSDALTLVRRPWGVSDFLQGNAWVDDGRLVDSNTSPAVDDEPEVGLADVQMPYSSVNTI
ncbi:diaminopimelate decarboxylase [Corynebacterium maris DSM 45190]|uniref:Diaminopimelate decarboxylase n=1 Tax=Corynebacterium maris DSM 45190 TaxID=1224163 RepID=S5SVS7_9CORY|nr:diaminopimelate decarboxylase [Corynebacterium maris DSM 45190]